MQQANLPDKLNIDSSVHLGPGIPIILIEGILNGDDGVLLNKLLVDTKQLVGGQLQKTEGNDIKYLLNFQEEIITKYICLNWQFLLAQMMKWMNSWLLHLKCKIFYSNCSNSTTEVSQYFVGSFGHFEKLTGWSAKTFFTHSPLGDLDAIFKLQFSILFYWLVSPHHLRIMRWMPRDLTDDKSTFVQVMVWCRRATSHYPSQCWPSSMSPYGVTRPQWVNSHRNSEKVISNHQWILPFRQYGYLKIWHWKSKVKVMGEVKGQGHIVGPTTYRLKSLSFHVNQPSDSCDMAI